MSDTIMDQVTAKLNTKQKRPICEKCIYNDRPLVPPTITGSKIVVVGEAPGREEASAKAPFVGTSGRLLRKLMDEVGFDNTSLSYLNTVYCHPPNNETPNRKALKCCPPEFLHADLAAIKPEVVILVGGIALNHFFPKHKIMDDKGTLTIKDGVAFFPVLHPAYCLRNQTATPLLRADLNKVQMFLKGELYQNREYTLAMDETQLQGFKHLLLSQEVISVDIETNNNLDPFVPDAKIVVISFGYAPGKSVCIPLDHPENININIQDKCREVVAAVLASKVPKVLHNCVFDLRWLRKFGFQVNGQISDTMIMSYLLDENRLSYSLKVLAPEFLTGYQFQPSETLSDMSNYCCEDSDYTLQLYHLFYKKLAVFPKLLDLMYKVVMPFCNVIVDMGLTGILIDTKYAATLKAIYEQQLIQLNAAVKENFPSAKNVDFASPKQLSNLLFKKMKFKPIKETKTGYSVDHEVLVKLAESQDCKLAKYLVDIRKVEKALSTYVIKIPPMTNSDGRLRGGFSIIGTRTGRLSCVASWTPVVTRVGIKEIKDVRIGDEVWTHKGRWCPVSATQIKGIEPMYDIYLCNGNVLTCTTSHKVLLSDGRWITIKEVADEYFKVMDQSKLREGVGSVQRDGLPNGSQFEQGTQDDFSQHFLGIEELSPGRGISSVEEDSILTFKDWRQESNEGEDRGSASQLDRVVRRQSGILNYYPSWEEAVCTSCGDGRIFRITRVASECCGSPYRRESQEQRHQQSCFNYQQWAYKNTLFTGKGQPVCAIKKIIPAGSLEVYDITVEEDHSYLSCGIFSHNSQNPNLQNIPRDKDIKKMFVAPEGYQILNVDASQAELRIGCSIAGERTMIKAYNAGTDIHALTASKILNKPLDKVSKSDRQKAKGVNFGFIYGQSAEGFMYYAEGTYGLKLSRAECEDFRRKFFVLYSGFLTWHARTATLLRRQGFIEYPTGRFARFPQVKGIALMPGDILRKAVNYPVQGSSSDIILFTMVCLNNFIKRSKIDAKIIITVHDSIVLECKEGVAQDITEEIGNIAQYDIPKYFPWLQVPMVFDSQVGRSWGELGE